ncbi:MAG: hypothetical protein IJO73_06725 [Clostridia bacterium]|nr:hypothetical protein [Clostridia bacterium]
MKKLISFLLVAVMLFAVMAPMASAANERTPVVYIRGNGDGIYYPDGTLCVAQLEDLSLGGDEGGLDKDTIVEAVVNILKPFVLEGMLFDEWDNYGRAIYDEISPLFPDSGLDENGNPRKGVGVLASTMADSVAAAKSAWYYNVNSAYCFAYDWRLSPYDHVDRLHEYVLQVLKTTGQQQVSMYARCMGGSLLSAYLERYGHLGLVKNVIFCDVLSNEATVISKLFSGQIEFDAKMVERYAGQLDFCGQTGDGVGFAFSEILYEIVFKTMSFFNQINVTDKALDGVEELYEKLYKALVPALLHATGMATQVNYWTEIAEEDMDAALNLVYGEKGSELRTKYAGLIEKIQYYREHISSDLDGFYKSLDEKEIHYGFIGKYGFMNAPFTADADLLSDSLVSLTHATAGATTAPIDQVLSDDYINARIAEDKGKYISPDKQVDLSTCVVPDRTWILKNAHHDVIDCLHPIIYAFLNGTNENADTVYEKIGLGRFLAYDYATNTASNMTAENSADYDFITRPIDEPTTETRLAAFMRFFTMLLNFITKLLKGELDFSNLLG